MITKEEISKIAFRQNLDLYQVEKDYVLSWILAGIALDPVLGKSWIFKGGTCIRKCYFQNYRYSEDLDFTINNKADLEAIQNSIHNLCLWITKVTAIEIDTQRSLFESINNNSGQTIIQGRIFYRGPAGPNPKRQWPRIKFDLTSDEIIVTTPEKRVIIHPYSDYEQIQDLRLMTYSLSELLAEKIRALFERTRPRDLYDVVEVFKRVSASSHKDIKDILNKKCAFKKIHTLTLDQLKIEACMAGWNSQLSKQLNALPGFDEYIEEFYHIYKALCFEHFIVSAS